MRASIKFATLIVLVLTVCSAVGTQLRTGPEQEVQRWMICYSPPFDVNESLAKHLTFDSTSGWSVNDNHPFRVKRLQSGWTLLIDPSTYGIDRLIAQVVFLDLMKDKITRSGGGEVKLTTEEIEALSKAAEGIDSFGLECLKQEPITSWDARFLIEPSFGGSLGAGARRREDGEMPSPTPGVREASFRLSQSMPVRERSTDLTGQFTLRQSSFACRPVGIPPGNFLMSQILRESELAAKDWLEEVEELVRNSGIGMFDAIAKDAYGWISGLPNDGASIDQLPPNEQNRVRTFYSQNWRRSGFASQKEAEMAVETARYRVRPMVTVILPEPASPSSGIFQIISFKL